MTNNNFFDPSFWESAGIEPIVVNSDNPEDIKQALEELTQRIIDSTPQPQAQQQNQSKE